MESEVIMSHITAVRPSVFDRVSSQLGNVFSKKKPSVQLLTAPIQDSVNIQVSSASSKARGKNSTFLILSKSLQVEIFTYLDATSRGRVFCTASSFDALKYNEFVQALHLRDRAYFEWGMINGFKDVIDRLNRGLVVPYSNPFSERKIIFPGLNIAELSFKNVKAIIDQIINSSKKREKLINSESFCYTWCYKDYLRTYRYWNEPIEDWDQFFKDVPLIAVIARSQYKIAKEIEEAMSRDCQHSPWSYISPGDFSEKVKFIGRALKDYFHNPFYTAIFCAQALLRSWDNYSEDDKEILKREYTELHRHVETIALAKSQGLIKRRLRIIRERGDHV